MKKLDTQDGFVAIFVSLIIMMILTLIVIGFTKLVQQEQRRTLDRQLNTQAFYAAETGINDAISGLRSGAITTNSTECENKNNSQNSWASGMDATLNVDYSCVLIDTNVTDIKKDNVSVVGRGQAFIMPLETESGGPLVRLNIQWDSPTSAVLPAGATVVANPTLPTTGAWGGSTMGGLRVDVTPTEPASLDRVNLTNQTMTFYVLPTSAAGGFTAVPANPTKGQILVANCDDPDPDSYRCSTTVNLTPAGQASYIMRISSLYSPTRLWVRPLNNINNSVTLRNGQVIIDSTGRAADVFRRIQERVPVGSEFSSYETPTFVAQNGAAICKRLRLFPGMTSSPDLDCGIN